MNRMSSPYATIIDKLDFDMAIYAAKLDRALKASDKDAIVKILTSISNNQRQMVSYAWRKAFPVCTNYLIQGCWEEYELSIKLL
ncbi:unnamed protein product [Cylicostephanus goldi]|uniref:Uncharacterized protein n=1 Tax=Cylicostephanus goldi TaxID=71465 RepID=A0A3P6T4W6_CYLGO|nr:unnamed protein product [Cylicostephanus goldi]